MILLRVSVDHIFSWREIYTSCVIYCVPCVIPRETIPRIIITRVTKHKIAMNGTCVGTNVQLTFVIHQQVTYKSLSTTAKTTHAMCS